MDDIKKIKLLLILTTTLTFLILAYNILEEYFLPGFEAYLQRRIYYERVISKKGLDLYKGVYWREKE